MKKTESYLLAKERAISLMALLSFDCERIELAGSIRRKKKQIGDIEIVVIPKFEFQKDLFGSVVGKNYSINDTISKISTSITKNGERYKQFEYGGHQIDLFLTTEERWGVIFTVRTGSVEFSKKLMTPQSYGGYLPFGMKVKDGRLWEKGEALETREERDYFEAIGLDWIEPENRD